MFIVFGIDEVCIVCLKSALAEYINRNIKTCHFLRQAFHLSAIENQSQVFMIGKCDTQNSIQQQFDHAFFKFL